MLVQWPESGKLWFFEFMEFQRFFPLEKKPFHLPPEWILKKVLIQKTFVDTVIQIGFFSHAWLT